MKYGNFSNRVLLDKLKCFLLETTTLATNIGEEVDGYLYTGVDLTRLGQGKTLQHIEKCGDFNPQLFSDEAVKAMEECENEEIKQKFERVNTLKDLLIPVTFDGKVKFRSGGHDKEIGRLRAECRAGSKVAPLIVYYFNGQVHTAIPLTDYMQNWSLAGVGNMLQTCPELEFSTGNYIKTLVFHCGDDVLILDCTSIYHVKESEPECLTKVGISDKLEKLVTNNHIPEAFKPYFTEANTDNILKHLRWIMPYGCGEEKHIFLSKRGKVQKNEEETNE